MIELISIHLPKTGGTSFCEFLSDSYGETFHHYKQQKLKAIDPKVDVSDLINFVPANTRVVHGHFKYQQIKSIHKRDDSKLVTWFRDPVKRVVSHYNFIRGNIARNSNHQFQDTIGKMSLLEFAQDARFRNLYDLWLKGISLDDFDFIGILERFDEHLVQFAQRYNLKLEQSYKKNVAKEWNPNLIVPTEHELYQILEWNDADSRIYQDAVNRTNLK